MPATSLLSLQPTFLQGFVVGQISILLLLALILKYLFFESAPPGSPTVLAPLPSPRSQQRDAQSAPLDASETSAKASVNPLAAGIESVEWFNLIIREVRPGGAPSGRMPPSKRKEADERLPVCGIPDRPVIQNRAARRSRGISR